MGNSRKSSGLEQTIWEAIPGPVTRIDSILAGGGFRAWLVGGCVRDLLLGAILGVHTPPKDWDLATDATPEQVIKLFRRVIPTGIAHGTVTVVIDKQSFEVTTLRGERGYSDGRHPDEVFFVKEIDRDLSRRDFTVNAIAYDLGARALNDPFGGQEDLKRGVLRAVGNPRERFEEDGLRVMRCARFASTLGLSVDEETRRAMRPALGSFRKVAVERIREEWFKALASAAPSRCLFLMRSEGLLEVIAPELFSGPTGETDLETACELIDRAGRDPVRRLALLCCQGIATEEQSDFALALGQRLKLSGKDKKRLVGLVTHHRPPVALSKRDGALPKEAELELRRWLVSVGRDRLTDVLYLLAELEPDEERGKQLSLRLESWAQGQLARGLPLSPGELAVSGGDLLEALARRPGRWLGQLLDWLLEQCLLTPENNQRERLIQLARQRCELLERGEGPAGS